ncbi:hypothetical protein GCM10010411_14710 [Actinomadura fulvescens]|uniref:HTH araC/xylS-type domain-containing protein n=2 Tax=Actinomadura fulvescens TaxID=46160 RepID=A0ABN3PFH0_9ACTN
MESGRTLPLIRQADPDVYLLKLFLRGSGKVWHENHRTDVQPGGFLLLDSSLPYRFQLSDHNGLAETLVVQVPRGQLALPSGQIDRPISMPFHSRDGVGAVFHSYLVELMKQADDYGGTANNALSTATLHLLNAMFGQWLDGPYEYDDQPGALLAQIHLFIEQRLGDPGLTPDVIAATHQISTRHLHRIFRHEGVGIAGWIRRRRLENCRRDLTDPQLRSQSVHGIAKRWGFSDGAHFSRLFRTTFGMPPGAYRRSALRPDGGRGLSSH